MTDSRSDKSVNPLGASGELAKSSMSSSHWQQDRPFLSKVKGRLLRTYRKWFKEKHYVFVHRGPFELSRCLVCKVDQYRAVEDIPEVVRKFVRERSGERAFCRDQMELQDRAIVWVARIGEMPAGFLFARRGSDFRRWFVQLSDHDYVFYRGRTYPEFRGRGVMPCLIAVALHDVMNSNAAAYCDCVVSNHSSRRCIEKAGFQLIGTMKPIRREDALG